MTREVSILEVYDERVERDTRSILEVYDEYTRGVCR